MFSFLFLDILGFEVESVNENNATVLVSLKRTPLTISVYYSKNLDDNYTSPYDDWDPDESDYIHWDTHSNYNIVNEVSNQHPLRLFGHIQSSGYAQITIFT